MQDSLFYTQIKQSNTMKTNSMYIRNAKNIRMSKETRVIIEALAKFEESFWNVCNALTPKGKDEELQYAYELQAEEEQEKARNAYYNTFKELEDLAKDKIFQVLLSSNYKEI